MIDPRFYVAHGPFSAAALAERAGAVVAAGHDGSILVSTCGTLEQAGQGGLAYCEKAPRDGLIATTASVCLVREADVARLPAGVVAVVTDQPRGAFAVAAGVLFSPRELEAGVALSQTARLEDGVVLGFGAVIGADAEIGAGTIIAPNAVIYPGVAVGRNCRIGAGVVLRAALIGDRVSIGAGTVVGESGFGVAPTASGPVDVPQLGRVILQDDVSIGALSAVDRGALADTTVGLASKIDNFCQIAHNVRIGRGVVIAAFGGISGSVEIGDHAMLGGRVGVPDHLTIGAGAQIAAMSGLMHSVPPRETWGGFPAKPIRDWHRETLALRRMVADAKAKGGKREGNG